MNINELRIADHLISRKLTYEHHGLYIGDGRVIQYSGVRELEEGIIEEVGLSQFSNGDEITVRDRVHRVIMNNSRPASSPPITNEQAVERARRRVGEQAYGIFKNNCEHFVNWCLYDFHYSYQAENPHEVALKIALNPVVDVLSIAAGVVGVVYDSVTGQTQSVRNFPSKDKFKAACIIREIEAHCAMKSAELAGIAGSLKIDFCHDFLLINARANQPVSRDNAVADATIKGLPHDLESVIKGKLDPLTAFLAGKIIIIGSVATACRILNVLNAGSGE